MACYRTTLLQNSAEHASSDARSVTSIIHQSSKSDELAQSRRPRFPMQFKRKHWITLVKILVPTVILGLLISWITPEQRQALYEQPKDYRLLFAALVLSLVALSVSITRWCCLVRCQGIKLSLIEAHRLGMIGYLLNFVSAGTVGGDFFKAIFLARQCPGHRVQAVTSVVVDRALGLYGLLLLALAAFTFGGDIGSGQVSEELSQLRIMTAVLAGLGAAGLAVLVFGGRLVDRLLDAVAKLPMIGALTVKVVSPVRQYSEHPWTLCLSLIMSLCVHGLLSSSLFVIAISLYDDAPTLIQHMIIVPISMLAGALPISPAGLGVFEATFDAMYKVVPSEPTLASGTIVALFYLLIRILIAFLGTVFYWTAGDDVRSSIQEAEADAEPSAEATVDG